MANYTTPVPVDPKNLQLPDRMKLLGKIIEKQANDPKQPFSSLALMTYLYSTRWYLHP